MTHALARTAPAPTARIVHLGLGAFSRSHTAWYTARASDAADWGIAAYTGNSTALVDALAGQDCVYTLVTRSAAGDTDETIESVVRVRPGADLASLTADLAAAETAIVTLTITEAGYRADPDGRPDLDDPLVRADREAVASLGDIDDLATVPVQTAIGRLVVGLEARRRAGAGPLAIVSCDNLPDNGGLLRTCLLGLASAAQATERWCEENVSFVSSSIDRITPRVDADEIAVLRDRLHDDAPVIAEPFTDWVLSGAFPAGRPRWEDAGARFTDELEPWEARKLWMLNGAHTILACTGPLLGHRTVADAIADPLCRRAVEAFWDEAERHLPADLELTPYRMSLLERFENPRIVHLLAQIALGSATKLRLRIVPVARLERAAGRPASASAFAVAAWIAAERLPGSDPGVRERLAEIAPDLARDSAFLASVEGAVGDLVSLTLV